MPLSSIGDLASSFTMLRHSTQLKQTMDRLTQELASGETQDVHARLGGNYAYLSDIDASHTRLQGYSIATTEVATTASAMQTSLAHLQQVASTLSDSLLAGAPLGAYATQELGSQQAAEDLGSMIAALNTQVAGRALFAGDETNTVPLASAETLLSDLQGALAGLTDPDDIRTAADAWFGAGGGFETSVYKGSSSDTGPVRISDTVQVQLTQRADDPALRDLLKETALAALAGDPALGLSEAQANTLRRTAGDGLRAASDDLIGMQGQLGSAQERIEENAARIAATQLSLEESRARLLTADPFETAARLEDAQFRLDALFTVAARSANLRLVNYL